MSVPPEQISCVNFFCHIIQDRIIAVGNDAAALVYNLKTSGTTAHRFYQSYDTEDEAIEAARGSEFLADRLSENLIAHVLDEKEKEAKEFAVCENKEMFETVRYFYTL